MVGHVILAAKSPREPDRRGFPLSGSRGRRLDSRGSIRVIPGAACRDRALPGYAITGGPATAGRDYRRADMAVRLGDVAPDFTAETTEGPISFHQWKGS